MAGLRHWPDVWYPAYVALCALPFAIAHAIRNWRDHDDG